MANTKAKSIVPADQITKFSYSFSMGLAKFLREAVRTDTLYIRAKSQVVDGPFHLLRQEYQTAVTYLAEQMRTHVPQRGDQILEFLSSTEKFLTVFKKKR